MPGLPSYEVVLEENVNFPQVGDGHPPYPAEQQKVVTWTGTAESPEAAIEAAMALWREEYGEDAPTDVLSRYTTGPDVCSLCKGRAWVQKFLPAGVTSRHDDPLGPAQKSSCPQCLGTGKVPSKGAAVRYR